MEDTYEGAKREGAQVSDGFTEPPYLSYSGHGFR